MGRAQAIIDQFQNKSGPTNFRRLFQSQKLRFKVKHKLAKLFICVFIVKITCECWFSDLVDRKQYNLSS